MLGRPQRHRVRASALGRTFALSLAGAAVWLLAGPVSPGLPAPLHGTPMAARGMGGMTHAVLHAPRASLDEITSRLMCTCGCSLTLAACEVSMACSIAPRMKAEAAAMIEDGLSTDEIFDAFVADYGERVRAAPTKSGFNLVAWVFPFLGLAVGVGFVVIALVKWRGREGDSAVADSVSVPVDSKYLAAIEDEVKRGM
ncbi:MAG: cytochrome c-type biogenesis protein CcmH [Actinomycetota bacterium]